MRIALLGTRGVPARYGGFETAVEEIGARLAERGHEVTVYCHNRQQTIRRYRGMRIQYLPAIRRRSLETLSHTGLAVLHAMWRRPDAAVLFNAGNAPFIPLLKSRGIPTAIHLDGLEWKRAKWRGFGAQYYKWAEAKAARSGLALIADAQGIADYLRETYAVGSYLIPYGAPIMSPGAGRLSEVGLRPHGYHLVVARLEPENHVDVIVEGYIASRSTKPLVVVGSAPYGDDYVNSLESRIKDPNVIFLGSVWDQELLNQLYANALSYVHGHSVGGTNPSLLRALGCGAAVIAWDVNFNREVTAEHARFFADRNSLAHAIDADETDITGAIDRGRLGQRHVASAYRWDDVAERYLRMLQDISSGN